MSPSILRDIGDWSEIRTHIPEETVKPLIFRSWGAITGCLDTNIIQSSFFQTDWYSTINVQQGTSRRMLKYLANKTSLDQPGFHYIRKKRTATLILQNPKPHMKTHEFLEANVKSIIHLTLAGTIIPSPPEIYQLSARVPRLLSVHIDTKICSRKPGRIIRTVTCSSLENNEH